MPSDPEPLTVITRLTPPGAGAIAVLAVTGPDAWSAVRATFKPRRDSLSAQPLIDTFWLGKLAGDEVVVAVRDHGFEIHCHGGQEVIRLIEETFASLGVKANGELQQSTEAALLARSPTLRTAGILLDQVRGAFIRADRTDGRLAELIPLGRHLVEPWRVVIAGAPNVGKSSLVNALAGFTRSVVAATPGTTRDVVGVRLAIDGWPVELMDTAGLRDADEDLEGRGILAARRALASADLRLWIVDGSAAPVWPEKSDAAMLIVINKCDLQQAWDPSAIRDALAISALTGQGIEQLCERISAVLVPNPPRPGEAVPITDEQRALAEQCRSKKTP